MDNEAFNESPNIAPYPRSQNAIAARRKSERFFIKTLTLFYLRVKPLSSRRKPAVGRLKRLKMTLSDVAIAIAAIRIMRMLFISNRSARAGSVAYKADGFLQV